MATLNEADRAGCNAAYQEDRQAGMFGALTKHDIRAAVDALDDYFHANAAAINNAIPQPARAQLTAAQKALIVEHVARRRRIGGA